MTSVLPSKSGEPGLAAFAPAEGSQSIQTPYGSLQLANSSANFLGMTAGTGAGESEEEEEEEEDDDDDEDGPTKGKRKRGKGAAGGKGGGKKATKGAAAAAGPVVGTASGDRDLHTGRRKIRIEFIEDDSRRHITFSKRKAGIMKKVRGEVRGQTSGGHRLITGMPPLPHPQAYELATLTGTQVLLLIVSQTGLVYTFTTPKLSPVVQQTAGRELIQSCLNAPEPGDGGAMNGAAGNDSNEGDHSHGSSEQDELATTDFASALSSHSHHQLPYPNPHADPFHDPRNGGVAGHSGNGTNMGSLNLNMPHLHGLSYGYPGHMNAHEQSIPYANYGL